MREPKTAQMIELEQKHGKPIESIITDAIQRCGSARAAAMDLGIKPPTLFTWMMRLRIQTKTIAYVA